MVNGIFHTPASFGNGEGNYLSQVCLPLANRNHFEKQQQKQRRPLTNRKTSDVKWVVKTNKWTKKDWKLWVFLLLKKEKLFAKFSTRHDKKMVTNTCLGTFSPKFFWYYLSKAFQNHKCHIQLKAKKNPLLLPLWKTRFFMVDEIQIERHIPSHSSAYEV